MNSRTRVKICGITRPGDAIYAAACGADSIGLMFHKASPRVIDIDAAISIRQGLPPYVTLTALFLNDVQDWIAQVLHRVKPDCLQFHGEESAQQCERWGLPYVKTIAMGSSLDPAGFARGFTAAQGFLFDSNAAGRMGGSGDTFDWSKIPSPFEHPLVLAGGLDASNVAEAIAIVKPWGVDVSSGVEASPGIKSHDLIDRFFDEVKRGDSNKNAN